MLAITSLLNPDPGAAEEQCTQSSTSLADPSHFPSAPPPLSSPQTLPSTTPNQSPTPTMTPKQQKCTKDQAVFVAGPPAGPVNYPPHDTSAEDAGMTASDRSELIRQHERFQLFPKDKDGKGTISDYVRHIPYSSDKKIFGISTGRSGFQVFQYTFVVPEDKDQKTHVVIWDYQIGLVRITPFFKACDYSKTTPKKAILTNSGLEPLSYSITGGALAAQGYWLPYHCARALCLTFCYNIRWVLTPIFGVSFVHECVPPTSPRFARFAIHPEYIQRAQTESEAWQAQARVKNAIAADSPAAATGSTAAEGSSSSNNNNNNNATTSSKKQRLRSAKSKAGPRVAKAAAAAAALDGPAAAVATAAVAATPPTPTKGSAATAARKARPKGTQPAPKRAKANAAPPAGRVDAGAKKPTAVDPQCVVRLNLRKKAVPFPGPSVSPSEVLGSRKAGQEEVTALFTPSKSRGTKRRFSWVEEEEGREEEWKEVDDEDEDEDDDDDEDGNSDDDHEDDDGDDNDDYEEEDEDDDETEDEKLSEPRIRSPQTFWSPASSESDDEDIVLPSASLGSLASRSASAQGLGSNDRAGTPMSSPSGHEAEELLVFAHTMVSLEGSVRDYSIDPSRVPF